MITIIKSASWQTIW